MVLPSGGLSASCSIAAIRSGSRSAEMPALSWAARVAGLAGILCSPPPMPSMLPAPYPHSAEQMLSRAMKGSMSK